MYPRQKGLDLSLCWHQPSITAWQMCRGVGGRLAEDWEAWSSRGQGTHSLARSIKHREPAFWAGNWAAWVLSPTVENVMLILDLKSTCKSFLCLAHSIEGAFDMSFRSVGPHGFLVVPSERAANAIGFLCRLQRNSFHSVLTWGKPSSFCDQ